MALTENRGVDVAIEATGIPLSFDICQAIVAAGGHIANIGVHGKPVQLNLDKLWAHNITLTTRLVDTVTTPMLLKTVASGKVQPRQLITHHFTLADVMKAYDTFGNAMKERALKIIMTNDMDLGRRNALAPTGKLTQNGLCACACRWGNASRASQRWPHSLP